MDGCNDLLVTAVEWSCKHQPSNSGLPWRHEAIRPWRKGEGEDGCLTGCSIWDRAAFSGADPG